MTKTAYLLVSHGSRDPRPEIAMQQLAKLVAQKLPNHDREKLVGTACLEVSSQTLHEQITEFVRRVFQTGYGCLKIIPIFLLPGVHVMQDIPTEVALAKKHLPHNITIDLKPYLGTHPSLANLLAKPILAKKSAAWILLAHGSRRPSAMESVEALAAKLAVFTAYWAVPPSLELRVQELIAAGKKEIGIIPYFLFAGGITDAIAKSIEMLELQSPNVNFHLAEPLGASAELSELIWDLLDT